jgi:hypothetical protein
MGTKSFVQIEINAVFTTTSGKMQFPSGVFNHFEGFFLGVLVIFRATGWECYLLSFRACYFQGFMMVVLSP